jgi:hypothetical protein
MRTAPGRNRRQPMSSPLGQANPCARAVSAPGVHGQHGAAVIAGSVKVPGRRMGRAPTGDRAATPARVPHRRGLQVEWPSGLRPCTVTTHAIGPSRRHHRDRPLTRWTACTYREDASRAAGVANTPHAASGRFDDFRNASEPTTLASRPRWIGGSPPSRIWSRYRGVNTQNSWPSGSAITTQVTSP